MIVLSTTFIIQKVGKQFTYDASSVFANFSLFVEGLTSGDGENIQAMTKTVVYNIHNNIQIPRHRRGYEVIGILKGAGVLCTKDDVLSFNPAIII